MIPLTHIRRQERSQEPAGARETAVVAPGRVAGGPLEAAWDALATE